MPHVEIKWDKGPAEVLRALASGDPEQLEEALQFQRESFRAKFGCYPEDLETVEIDHVEGCSDINCSCPDKAA